MFYRKDLKKSEPISYTQIRTEKKTDRVDVRIEPSLKKTIDEVLKDKGKNFSECTRLLWLNYLAKIEKVKGFQKEEKLIHGIHWELE